MKMLQVLWMATLSAGLASCAATTSSPGRSADSYRSLVENPIRTDRDRGMDATRHPAELLEFAQVRPGMRVLDLVAGAGYTSQILALAVGPSGKVWAQAPNPGATLNERLAAHPQENLVVAKRPFDDPVPPEAIPLDLVTLILNYHDISYLPVDRDVMNLKIFAALKPGGHYVIVDHSALPGTGVTAGKTLHRIDEAFLIEEVRRAGFVLEAEGGFMRNPADKRDISSNEVKPVSDRFVLRFVKPAGGAPRAAAVRDGLRDFDWEAGTWKTHVRRLQRPFSGSTAWLEYDGTTVVTPVLDGRANVAELRVAGAAGRIEGAALRIYEPQAGRWTIHYFNASDGELTSPLAGRFDGGVGRFEGDDRLGELPIRVRFEMRQSSPGTWRFEQAFSRDGGRTWELNWIAEDRREGKP